MSTSFWLDNTSRISPKDFDVVIVGAGVAGVSTAYWLQKEDPNLKIALLEKHRLAFGASGRNAGFVTCGSVEHFNRLVETRGKESAKEIWSFSETNLDLLKSEIFSRKPVKGFKQSGSFSLASTIEELGELKRTQELMSEMNIQAEFIDESGIKERLGASEFVGGIKYLDDAEIHPVELVRTIHELSGVPLFENTEVFNIDEKAGRKVVRTDNGDFHCDMVVYALNGYLSQLDPYFEDKVFPTRGQILTTEPVEKFMEGPCYCNFVLDYFRQVESGELIIGGFRQLEKDTETGFSDHLAPKIQTALEDFFRRHLPKFSKARITHKWSGIMGFSADGQPLVGSLPNDPQIFFLGGFTAHGLGLAFHSAKCLTDLVFNRPIPDFISARRF